MSNSNLAILYFSRNVRVEGEHKRWFGRSGGSRNRQVATALIAHSCKTLQGARLPVYRYHEGNQRGSTFGERLANAYDELFGLGYTGVIAVGNDTPELAAVNWDDVTAPLNEGRCVLGASLRGGAYLIGLTAAAFDKDSFQHLPWQTSQLFLALENFCARQDFPSHLLPALRDVNTFQDLLALVRVKGFDHSLHRFIARVLWQGKCVYTYLCSPIRPAFTSLSCLRGPPAPARLIS